MVWTFQQPGSVSDFANPGKWHDRMADLCRDIVRSMVAEVLGKMVEDVTQSEVDTLSPKLGYVDPTVEEPPEDADVVNIQAWSGFPRAVERLDWSDIASQFDPVDPDGRYRAVEGLGDEDHPRGVFTDFSGTQLSLPVRHRQDEYLEWEVAQDGRSVAFVSEGYDYYSALFAENEQAVVDLYREHTGNGSITADDLRAPNGIVRWFDDGGRRLVAQRGEFNPRNRFNSDGGIVHLSHRANSLSAEVFLAGNSALARLKADGTLLKGADAEELLCCNRGGEPNRNSDPIISKAAYAQLLLGKRYTLANPVGLYIADVRFDALLMPNGTDPVPREWWHDVRGSGLGDPATSRVLRLELRIPDDETFDGRPLRLGDLRISGGPLRYPGQLAELVSVHLFVTAWSREGGGTGPQVPCRGTCCARGGSPLLFPTSSSCGGDFSDKFPGLIDSGRAASAPPPGSMHGRTAPPDSGRRD